MGVETERVKGFGPLEAASCGAARRAYGIAAQPSAGGERSEETNAPAAGGTVVVRTRKVVVSRGLALR